MARGVSSSLSSQKISSKSCAMPSNTALRRLYSGSTLARSLWVGTTSEIMLPRSLDRQLFDQDISSALVKHAHFERQAGILRRDRESRAHFRFSRAYRAARDRHRFRDAEETQVPVRFRLPGGSGSSTADGGRIGARLKAHVRSER